MRYTLWAVAAVFTVGLFVVLDPADAQRFGPGRHELQPVYRFFNPDTADHLYAIHPRSEDPSAMREYRPEGIEFYAGTRPRPGLVLLLRYTKASGGHFYATAGREPAGGRVRPEGPLGYISTEPQRGLVALHEWYHRGNDRHFYTTDPSGEQAPQSGYTYLGVVGYVVPGRR
jgi:hypothetical protein